MRAAVEFPVVVALTLLVPGLARWTPAWRQAQQRRAECATVATDARQKAEAIRAAQAGWRGAQAADQGLEGDAVERRLERLAGRCPVREDGPAALEALLERVRTAPGVIIVRATPEAEPQDFLTDWRAHRLALELKADYAGLRALLVDLEAAERLLRIEDLALRPAAEAGQIEARLVVARFTRRGEGGSP